jgi:branched-chain amino acid transport system ATP-binding protein
MSSSGLDPVPASPAPAGSVPDELIRAEGIVVNYGGLRAVNGIDLTVCTGQCVVLLGPNGAGKTSLVNTLAGVVTPARGDVKLHGTSIRKLRTEQRAARGIAMVPEGRRLFSTLTVEQNLLLAKASKRNPDFAESLDQVLQSFPVLGQRLKQSARTLSGGEQQMLAIGRALLTAPELLILDEPSIGLAPKVVHEVYERLNTVRSQGITLLIVEQNVSALELANEVHVLSNGSVVSSGPPEQYRDTDVLAAAYLGSTS